MHCKGNSAYSQAETVERLKCDVAAKGIRFFQEIDQAKLAALLVTTSVIGGATLVYRMRAWCCA